MINVSTSNRTESTNWFHSIEINTDYRSSLVAMMVLLSLILLFMLILLCLPKSVQDTVIQWITRQTPDQSFNYIDVGLYKTRHSMYRKEVYSLAMQTNRRTKPSTTITSPESKCLAQQIDASSNNIIISNNNVIDSDDKHNSSIRDNKIRNDRSQETETISLLSPDGAQVNKPFIYHKKPEVLVTLVTNETLPTESEASPTTHCPVNSTTSEQPTSWDQFGMSCLNKNLPKSYSLDEMDHCDKSTHLVGGKSRTTRITNFQSHRFSDLSKNVTSVEKLIDK